jgi:hypothetical protein
VIDSSTMAHDQRWAAGSRTGRRSIIDVAVSPSKRWKPIIRRTSATASMEERTDRRGASHDVDIPSLLPALGLHPRGGVG